MVNIEKEELPMFYELFDSKVITDYKVINSKPHRILKNGIIEKTIIYTIRITIDVAHYKFKDNIKTKKYSKFLG